MHPNNLHIEGYDFEKLTKSYPKLKDFVIDGKAGRPTISFSNPEAVKSLNAALLKAYYKVNYWDIPEGYLCPPIPGRADYLLAIEDILDTTTDLKASMIKGLDLGTGANLIYPLIGKGMLDWRFVGTEVDDVAIENAVNLIKKNKINPKDISVRKQEDSKHILEGILRKEDRFAFCICNPPFHKSAKEALASSQRKVRNLTGKRTKKPKLNFGGQSTELWCEGGELAFIHQLIEESKDFGDQVIWFTTLVSKSSNMGAVQKFLRGVKPAESHIIDMGQGQKKSRFVAWTFNKELKK
ncbi:23S rRNA (adenine(1618)-N(6))-methyltransferase RlmF [Flammeovirga pectinis]|uniref:Ribosomal RNA large subunit methyltransferase F n=1 Tax=Flammeovirga pectinis TaxID=2494373 RepID=A0A3Q9FQI9_9BACT|nr:23S rRNA (adenine(1618)-N(6))-methyltransferase RlmF [Flammeovirga pectinis]AZQ65279.1 23S rRNA (adenine(1618)-N(6))-methyltransferase RlmF [Flammeovirga pectinis]